MMHSFNNDKYCEIKRVLKYNYQNFGDFDWKCAFLKMLNYTIFWAIYKEVLQDKKIFKIHSHVKHVYYK